MAINTPATTLSRTVADAPAASPSPAYAAWLRSEGRRSTFISLTRALLLLSVLVLWEVLARTHVMNPMLTSYPSAVSPTFLELLKTGDLVGHTWATFRATLIGFTIS